MLAMLQSIGTGWRIAMFVLALATIAAGFSGAAGGSGGGQPAPAQAERKASGGERGERDFASQMASGYNGGRPRIDASRLANSTAGAGEFVESHNARIEAGQFGTGMGGGDFSGE